MNCEEYATAQKWRSWLRGWLGLLTISGMKIVDDNEAARVIVSELSEWLDQNRAESIEHINGSNRGHSVETGCVMRLNCAVGQKIFDFLAF